MSVPREAPGQDRLIGKLAELRTRAEREQFLRSRPEAHRRELVIALDLEVTRRVRVDLKKALALAESAVFIAQAISDPTSLALGLRAKANALMLLDRHQEALELYQRSVALFESLSEREQVARTLSSSIGAWMWLGRYEGAFAAAEKARAIFAERGDTQRLARLDINVATVYHRQDRFQEALSSYERAYRQLLAPSVTGGPGESEDPERERARTEGLAVTLSNLATCLIIMNDFDRALETYSRARSFCDAHGMPTLVALVDYNIAYLYYLRGQYSTALELYKGMRERFRKLEDRYHEALCLLDESEMYLELNLSGDAEETAKAAFETFRDLSTGYEAGKARLNQAIACAQLGKTRVALALFREARGIFDREKSEVQLSVIDLYQALVLFEEGRFFEARRVARRALSFFESFSLPRKTILCRLLLARLSLRIGDLTAAEWECRAAREALEVCEAPILEYQAHCLMGQVQEALGKPGAAQGAYESAQRRLEMLRSSLQREDLKIAFMKNRFEVYESQVALCLEEDRQAPGERVFSYIEQAKSRGLIDLLLQSVDRRPPENPGSEGAARLRNLREELNWYYHRIELEELRAETGARDRIRSMRQQALLGEEKLLRAVRELPSDAVAGSSIRTTEPRSLAEVQRQLAPDAILLEYYRARERLMACVVTRDRLEVVELGSASRARELVRRLQFQLSKFRLGMEYVRRFQEPLLRASNHHLAALHQELVAPVRDRLDARHLVVVPHDFLHYLPFHALRSDGRYLIDDFTVSYAPSASIFAHCQTLPGTAGGRTLILGFPDERTPHIVDEIRAVAEASEEPTVLLGSSASRKALIELGPGCAVVHIATHGYFRRDNPMFSAVRLGDSYLSLYDLYQLELPVGLVTLSACATGSSVVVEGDELLGLVRGLLCAGAQSLLVTLWDVQDRATAEFMKSFYSRLRETRDPSGSLRDATLSLRESHPHPYYWAPFVWTGKLAASQLVDCK
jgi:CHAT domain-containing protein